MKKLFRSKLFLAMVAVPFALVCAYYAVLVEPRFTSEARVALKSVASDGQLKGLGGLLAGGGSDKQDELYLVGRANSLEMALRVDQALGTRKSWSSSAGTDIWHRTWGETAEDYLSSYRKMVDVHIDPIGGEVVVRATTFDAKQALDVVKFLVRDLEEYTNAQAQELAAMRGQFAEREAARLHDELKKASSALADFQAKNGLLDVEGEARLKTAAVDSLEAEKARAEADLRGLQAYLTPESAAVKSKAQQVEALRAQIAIERAKMTTGARMPGTLMAQFAELKLASELALHKYKTALASQESARVDTERQAKVLSTVAQPYQGERPSQPRYLVDLATALAALVLAWGATVMVAAIIKEHRV